jgi:phenylacetic acid degradation operon negative regulatory protein
MVETFILGGRAIHQLVYDPLLPEPIVPAAERRALIDLTRRYDRLGRDCWSRFMRAHGAPARRTPTGVRIATTPAAAIAAGSSPRSA